MNNTAYLIVTQNNPVVIAARVADITGSLITQSSVSSLTVSTVNAETQTTTTTSSPTVADVVFNSLQTGSVWSTDSIGYNLLVTADGFTDADTRYQVQIVLTPTAGDVFTLTAIVRTRPIY